MPEQVAVSFEIVVAVIEFDDAIVSRAEPVSKKGHFAMTGGINHAAGYHKFSVSIFCADENLIGGEDHVFETFHGIDGFDLTSALLQNTTEDVPLAASLSPGPLRILSTCTGFF